MTEMLILWMICAGLGVAVDGGRGFVLGLLFGPIGAVVAVFMASREQ